MRDSVHRSAAYQAALSFALVLTALGCALDATPEKNSRRSFPKKDAGVMEAPSDPPEDLETTIGATGSDDDAKTASGAASSDDDAGVAPPCVSDCEGRECGSDGCQGSCGSCGSEQRCHDASGRCEDTAACKPHCADRECGSDGCGGSCGTCAGGSACDGGGSCSRPGPSCGNSIVESGEECDGGDRCGSDCRNADTDTDTDTVTDFAQCQEFGATDAPDACKQCVCDRCTQLAIACYVSGDPRRDQSCGRLAECGNRNGCYDYDCYCGDALLCLAPAGLCKAETELAAGSTDVTAILACYDDPDCANYRARTLGECLVRECPDVCGP
jgi:hypothetical protein